MGYPGYFLIVADFIEWARKHRIPVGPGRGSGAGSLVAYALGITDLDPIRHGLLFERFLNPERVSLPDFDVDFCMEGRDRVIDYVVDRYSADHVAQIITFGTMAAKAVVRDVGRVLGHPYGFVDQIAKLIPFELGITLDRALAEEGSEGAVRGGRRGPHDHRSGAQARRAGPQRGTPCRGRGDRPEASHRIHSALPGARRGRGGHPVRQGRRRGDRTREVRLPRPAHPHHHRLGPVHHQRAAPGGRRACARSRHPAHRRPGHLRAHHGAARPPPCSSSNRAG